MLRTSSTPPRFLISINLLHHHLLLILLLLFVLPRQVPIYNRIRIQGPI
jgi:hypothetical protein